MTILEELYRFAEEDYKTFNNRITPTAQTMLGVRIPVLRKIAKRLAEDEPFAFVRTDKRNIYEMIMLEGMVLSYLDRPFTELLPFTEAFLGKVDNWAQIDSTISYFRNITYEQDEVLAVVRQWIESEKQFVVRAALVLLLTHYVKREHLQMIFTLSQHVVHKGYYVHMANAWLVSVCMAHYPDETMAFFRGNTLDDITHNKAIQKSRESYRVSKEHKRVLNGLKRK